MATKILGGLTVIVLLLSAFIGMKNSEARKDQMDKRDRAERNRDAASEDLESVAQKLEEAKTESEDLTAKAAEEKANLSNFEKEAKDLAENAVLTKQRYESNEKEIAELQEEFEAQPKSEDLVPSILKVNEKLAKQEDALAADKADLEEVGAATEQVKGKLKFLSSKLSSLTNGTSAPSLNTKIQSVFGKWGFVTLRAGNAQGVVAGSTLDVLRGGEVVAKLKVTAVEQYRATADIITDVDADELIVRAGDTVVAEQIGQ